jgi:predicted nucleotidyltransferase
VIVAGTRVEHYVAEIVEAIAAAGPQITGAFVLGSALLGGFDPGKSDLDAVVVVSRPLGAAEREAVVAALDQLPVPFRKLELVVYAEGARPPAYELNYPDGDGEPAFWFVLDAAIAQEHAKPLGGRPWDELLEPVTEDETRRAAEDLLRWGEERGDEVGRLHAVRARHYLEHREWITKKEAKE